MYVDFSKLFSSINFYWENGENNKYNLIFLLQTLLFSQMIVHYTINDIPMKYDKLKLNISPPSNFSTFPLCSLHLIHMNL